MGNVAVGDGAHDLGPQEARDRRRRVRQPKEDAWTLAVGQGRGE